MGLALNVLLADLFMLARALRIKLYAVRLTHLQHNSQRLVRLAEAHLIPNPATAVAPGPNALDKVLYAHPLLPLEPDVRFIYTQADRSNIQAGHSLAQLHHRHLL